MRRRSVRPFSGPFLWNQGLFRLFSLGLILALTQQDAVMIDIRRRKRSFAGRYGLYAPNFSWKKSPIAAHERLSVFSLYRIAGLSEPSASGLVKLCRVLPY